MKKNIREWLAFLLTLAVILAVCGTLLFLILVSLTGLLRDGGGTAVSDEDNGRSRISADEFPVKRAYARRCGRRVSHPGGFSGVF